MMYWKVLTTRYAQFSGRAGRREFWLFMLVHYIIGAVLSAVDLMVFFGGSIDRILDESFPLFPITTIYGLLVLIPGLALSVRRLHDIGRSGWWQALVAFWPLTGVFGFLVAALDESGSSAEALALPGILTLISLIAAVIGSIILLVFAVRKGDDGDNAYGPPGEAPA